MGIMGVKWTDERLNNLRLRNLANRRQDYMDRYKKAVLNNERISAELYNDKIMEIDKLMTELRAM